MTGDTRLPAEVLDRYTAGLSDAAERALVERALLARPQLQGVVAAMRELSAGSEPRNEETVDVAGAWKAWRTSRAAIPQSPRGILRNRMARSLSAVSLGIGVCLLAAVTIDSARNLPGPSKPVVKTKAYSTHRAQRAYVKLADGSSIVLAPSTTVRVAGRSMTLRGEAIFTVAPNADAPVVVQAGNAVVRVLGTTFSIRAYESDAHVRVAVAVGRVSVASTVLSAGDVAVVPSRAAPLVTAGADISSVFGWTSGRLAFERAPFPSVLRELERWYNVRFVISDDALSKRFVSVSLATGSLDESLLILSGILSARVERTPSVVTFYAR